MTPIRKALLGGGLAAATLTGGALGATLLGTAGAAEDTTSTTAAQSTAATGTDEATAPARRDPSQGGHAANGKTETLLTGDDADKARAAALAAVPGGTIERVETDAEGDAYEAHMVKSDGSHVTVKMDESFKVVRVEDGHPQRQA